MAHKQKPTDAVNAYAYALAIFFLVLRSLRSKRFRGAKSEETGFSAFCPREN